MKSNSSNPFNMILLLIIGLLAGGIAGFLVGQSSVNPMPTAATGIMPANLNDVIPLEYVSIVEGLSCPEPGCTNPLLTCPGELSRRIRDWVNRQLALGRSPQDIRAEIIRAHGQNVYKLPGVGP